MDNVIIMVVGVVCKDSIPVLESILLQDQVKTIEANPKTIATVV